MRRSLPHEVLRALAILRDYMDTEGFAMVPENGPPRLYRFIVPEEDMVEKHCIAVLYPDSNVLVINREKFEELIEFNKGQVLKQRTLFSYMSHGKLVFADNLKG